MLPFLTLFGIVAFAFVSTNLDNLLLLVGWQLDGRLKVSQLFSGYMLGMLAILIISITIGLVGYLFPIEYLGLLGFIPIAVGIRLLLKPPAEERGAVEVLGSTSAVAGTQLSNGVDTVLVFSPLLADSQFIFDVEIALQFLLLSVLWFVLARLVGRRAAELAWMSRAGRWLTPVVMIAVGCYIFANTATDLNL
ncbi:MAG: cadmium resistance transporter [Pseudomonadota bacterium]